MTTWPRLGALSSRAYAIQLGGRPVVIDPPHGNPDIPPDVRVFLCCGCKSFYGTRGMPLAAAVLHLSHCPKPARSVPPSNDARG